MHLPVVDTKFEKMVWTNSLDFYTPLWTPVADSVCSYVFLLYPSTKLGALIPRFLEIVKNPKKIAKDKLVGKNRDCLTAAMVACHFPSTPAPQNVRDLMYRISHRLSVFRRRPESTRLLRQIFALRQLKPKAVSCKLSTSVLASAANLRLEAPTEKLRECLIVLGAFEDCTIQWGKRKKDEKLRITR